MTLRMRLFLIVGGLIAVLVSAQWWWTRTLARELSAELDDVASAVTENVAGFFVADHELRIRHFEGSTPDCKGEECLEEIRRSWSWSTHSEHDHEVAEHGPSKTADGVAPEGETDSEDSKSPDEKHLDGFAKARHKVVQILENAAGQSATREGYLEFDSETGDVRIEGDLRLLEDDVEVTDLGEGRYAFALRLPGVDPETGHSVLRDKKIQIHLEHEGENRFLFMDDGGPRHLVRRFEIPSRGVRDKLEGFTRKLMLASLGILAVGLVFAGAVAHRMSAPLRRLSEAAREVGSGALGTQVPESTSGEVGQAIAAFNQMSGRLAELEARTRELNASQHLGEIGEIARGLAHSLRNPLNALGLSVEELAARAPTNDGGSGGADDPERTELVVKARRQIRRIDGSIRSFLALASEGTGSTADNVDLAELAADVALEALQDGGGRVRIETDVKPGVATLRAVEPELRAVIQALVVNAVEASPPDGMVSVRLRALDGTAAARLTVEDRGPGLATEVRERLFTPHLSTKASGSGMGLFLAHRIATNRYGGQLELNDREGGGTVAVLDLGDRTEHAPETSR